MDMRLIWAGLLAERIMEPLRAGDPDLAITFMDEMSLCREDVDSLVELCGLQDAWTKGIPAATKSAFTRKYNAGVHRLPYAIGGVASAGQSIRVPDLDIGIEEDGGEDGGEGGMEDGEEEGEEGQESVREEDDKMIKSKKSGIGKSKNKK